jgi:hypothetical protein
MCDLARVEDANGEVERAERRHFLCCSPKSHSADVLQNTLFPEQTNLVIHTEIATIDRSRGYYY